MPVFKRLLDLPYLLLAFAPLCWAGNLIVGRAVRDAVPPIAINWWRWSVALVVLLLFVGPRVWRQRHLIGQHWRYIALLSLSGLTCFHSAVYIGLQQTTAINAALIIALGPILILPLAWGLLGERLGAIQGLGVVISFLGAAIIILRGDLAVAKSLSINRGDLWLLFASACWAVYSVLLKRKPAALETLPMLAGIMLGATILTSPLYLWEISQGQVIPLAPVSFATIGYVSLFAGILAYIAWNQGVVLVGPSKAGLFLHLIPVYGTLLAALFLGERLQGHHLAGFAFILLGILLTTRARAPTPARR